jgi:hypothetical protein
MRVWLDTEFSDLLDPMLISVGLAAEDDTTLYVELAEGQCGYWSREICSEFVRDVVIPLLEPATALPAAECSVRIRAYLEHLVEAGGGELEAIVDYSVDADLVQSLLGEPVPGVRWTVQPLTELGQLYADRELERSRQHHALDDAIAFRAGGIAERVPEPTPSTVRLLWRVLKEDLLKISGEK